MPKPSKGPRLGGSPAHERIILANLASQLFEHGRITTTERRAKRLQPLAEKLIAKAKRGDLHSRRLVFKTVPDRSVVHYLFTELAPALAERDGGCTRITKIGPRKGDNAPMAVIEVVRESVGETQAARARAAGIAGRKARAARPASKPAAVAPETAEAGAGGEAERESAQVSPASAAEEAAAAGGAEEALGASADSPVEDADEPGEVESADSSDDADLSVTPVDNAEGAEGADSPASRAEDS